jgi:hypothetical protein
VRNVRQAPREPQVPSAASGVTVGSDSREPAPSPQNRATGRIRRRARGFRASAPRLDGASCWQVVEPDGRRTSVLELYPAEVAA